jgi:hypothetical protein
LWRADPYIGAYPEAIDLTSFSLVSAKFPYLPGIVENDIEIIE